MSFRVTHFISLCGLSCASLLSFQRFDDGTFESMKKNLVQLLQVNFGRLPTSFERALKEQPPDVIETIMRYFYESVQYMHKWAIDFMESNKLLECDMLYVRGDTDPTTKDDLWRVSWQQTFTLEMIYWLLNRKLLPLDFVLKVYYFQVRLFWMIS
jgi:hypothetical protein